MSSDVVLTAALRNNLLSLQNTQSLIDKTQLRLATGLKVNSALDNAQNFFAAQSLSNRASDLNRLLDGIGQSIQTIKSADNAVSSLLNLIEQADSVATQARDALAGGSAEARVTGNRDLSGETNVTAINGIANGDTIVISVTDPDSTTAGALVDFDTANGGQQDLTITFNTNDSIEQIIAEINDNNNLTDRVVEARLDSEGNLEIKSLNGGNARINFVTAAATDAANLGLAQALGFGDQALIRADGGNGTNNVEVTALSTPSLTSFALYEASGNLAERSDLISALTDNAGTALNTGINNAGDTFSIGINGGSAVSFTLNAATIQSFIDTINTNTSLNELVQATFDDETGQITIRAVDSSVQTVQIGFTGNAANDALNIGFGTHSLVTGTAANAQIENLNLGAAAGELATLEEEYTNILSQIDQLVGDAGYRGTNLLNGDDLTTFFNEDRSSSLITEGVVFTSGGLGVSEANFARLESVDDAITEIRLATDTIRSFGNSIANDLAIIQTREDFTKNTINNLEEGADKLTVADQNEEGANLLALQTRQTLGVTSLALASQSQQAVLRLF
ncbi:MAG: flagellin [Alphaproteobacteria bacterium]|jgi:flagellin|nr:flagellin [Alphaproteobacteria bacterium]QQS58477.1 MAG: flagellin [Alphaproteobacteria bacterium]